MWGNFESCLSEEETVTHAFCTNGLFKISSDEPVSFFFIYALNFFWNKKYFFFFYLKGFKRPKNSSCPTT